MFHNILVGIDGTPASECALRRAVEIALDARARLTILTAVGRLPAFSAASGDATLVAQLTNDLRSEALERLDEAVAGVPAEIPVTKLVSFQPVREALLRRVATGCHDLLVVGTRGLTGLRGLFAGSVSRHLVQHCDVPVLVVHAERPTGVRDRSPSRRTAGVARPGELYA
ncbi:universal stress protein [Conexibacter arvalis]|uniref:Nucleotide-binding universal stress UspA family protein n=1 Tax=Conexibacter arvalis TaxID=912552 RepID=A0A840IJ45_9ACTN|nr:nucleotide-binding universal stress UspA family protein [Conexibacter arvalis]